MSVLEGEHRGGRARGRAGARDRVLAAARRLFVRRGYFNTSMPEIVREAGVSVGSIYHHFADKQAIAAALYRETMEGILAAMREQAEPQPTTRGRLEALTRLLYEACERDPDRLEYMLFVRHTEVDPEERPVCLAAPFQAVARWIGEGQRRGEVVPGPADLVAGVFMGSILKVAELRLRGRIDRTLPRIARDAFALAWRAIAAPI
ncbi:MAG TPA: helix-turn-helix domain-containing protein [Anaeromyxobacteraceae bacterium]|nr:helix-turn-helix domain-containing protein [Anaeromyxobacteraceae bacterium]